jgi:hypothetical protein
LQRGDRSGPRPRHRTGAGWGDCPGAPLGISYGNVTRYLDVEATRYDVRLVAPGSADCNRALVPDVGLGVGRGFQRVFANVAFSTIGTGAPLDALGYIEASPFTAPVTARLAGATTDALTVPSVTLAAGQIATAFAIGNKTGSRYQPAPRSPLRRSQERRPAHRLRDRAVTLARRC